MQGMGIGCQGKYSLPQREIKYDLVCHNIWKENMGIEIEPYFFSFNRLTFAKERGIILLR